MANKELAPLMVEGNFISKINALSRQLQAISRRETQTTMVSDITNDLGDMRAGRFLALYTGDEPTDSNAAGVVMDAAGQDFEGEIYNLYGVDAGSLTFGIRASDGKAVFCSGNATIDADGISGTDLLKWMIRQTATAGGAERVGKFAMSVPTGETVPALELSLSSAEAVELATNGDLETGDFTGFTKTTETNGAWSIDSAVKAEGSYSVKWTPTILGKGYVKSLLHFDGADASTTMTDENGRTWTARGNAQLDTAQKVFGTASLLLDGTGDYIDTPDSADFNVGSGDWEIELRFRCNAINKIQRICGRNGLIVYVGADNLIKGAAYGGGSYRVVQSSSTISANTWYTVSLSRFNNSLVLRVDGTTVDTEDFTGLSVIDGGEKFSIGRLGEVASEYYDGWIDEFIFLKGGVIHEADYTPAVAAYGAITLATGVLTNDRVACTAGTSYTCSAFIRSSAVLGTIKAEAKWYDHASAGSLIQTDILGTVSGAGSFQQFDQVLEAPTGALSVAIVLTSNLSSTAEVHFDLVSVAEATVNQKLTLRDDGLYLNGVEVGGGASYPRQADMFFDCVLFVPNTGGSTPTVNYDTSAFYDLLVDGQQNANNNGNQYYFNVYLAAGTYTLNTVGYTNSASPITKVYIDSSLVATFDWYSGSATYNVVKSQTGITVATDGVHEIKFVIDGQNASANGNYRWRVTKAMIWRTGA